MPKPKPFSDNSTAGLEPPARRPKATRMRTEVHNGRRVPVGHSESIELLAAQSLEDAALRDYKGDNPEYILEGKNNLEAAVSSLAEDAAQGVPPARTEFLDRIMGRPVQRTDNVNRNVTLLGFLDKVAEAENISEAEYDISSAAPGDDVGQAPDDVPEIE